MFSRLCASSTTLAQNVGWSGGANPSALTLSEKCDPLNNSQNNYSDHQNLEQSSRLNQLVPRQLVQARLPIQKTEFHDLRDPLGLSILCRVIQNNTIVASREASAGLTELELDARSAVLDRLSFANGDAIVLNSRAQAALETLRLARDKCLADSDINIKDMSILVSDWDRKNWVEIAAAVGFSEQQVIAVQTDASGKKTVESMRDAVSNATSDGKQIVFWTANLGLKNNGCGVPDPVNELAGYVSEHRKLMPHAWGHLEGGLGSEGLLGCAEEYQQALDQFDSVHVDTFEAGLNLPGRGQLVAIKDKYDNTRHIKTESSKYLYHEQSERADHVQKNQNADVKRSLGPNSPLCTQGSSLASLWWHLRTQGADAMLQQHALQVREAQKVIDILNTSSLNRSLIITEGAENNGRLVFSLPDYDDQEIEALLTNAKNLYGLNIQKSIFRGRALLSIKLAEVLEDNKASYIACGLRELINDEQASNHSAHVGEATALPIIRDADLAYKISYEGINRSASEAAVAQFFEINGLRQNKPSESYTGAQNAERDGLLADLLQVIDAGPNMSTRNHNQVGGFVAPDAASRIMNHLISVPAEAELIKAYDYLSQFLHTYVDTALVAESASKGARLQAIVSDSGTTANKQAVLAACKSLQQLGSKNGKEVDLTKLALFVPETAHYSFEKAAETLGIPISNLFHVDVRPDQSTDINDLDNKVQAARALGLTPAFVSGIFGTTTVGAIDCVNDISAYIKRYNDNNPEAPLWFHIDAAQGFNHLGGGDENKLSAVPDSMTMDWHKSGFCFNTLATLMIYGHQDLGLVSTWREHPELVGIAEYLQNLGPQDKADVTQAVSAAKALAEKARNNAKDFSALVQRDKDCPFEIVSAPNNHMVAVSLKSDIVADQSISEVEQLIQRWRARAADGADGKEWAFNLVHVRKRTQDGLDREVPCLRVNFVNHLHNEKTVKDAFSQLKIAAGSILAEQNQYSFPKSRCG